MHRKIRTEGYNRKFTNSEYLLEKFINFKFYGQLKTASTINRRKISKLVKQV